MMIMARNPRDHKTPSTKQEPCFQEDGKAPAVATGAARARASSGRAWPGLKDPRIVRVSRAFGGKDRHSKVSTVRGLRDRRVRLSVQTAIQLYDLQERLGLNQPSKVVDWLLDAAGHEIDKLPPLQIPPGMSCFLQFPPPPAAAVGASHHAVPPPPSAVAAASDVNPMEEGSTGAGSSSLALGNYDRGGGHVEHQEPPLACRDNQHHAAEVIPVHGNLHRLGFLSMLNGGGGGGGGNTNYGSYCLLETPSVYAQQTHGQLGGCYSMTTSQAAEETHGYRPVAPPPLLSLSHASQLLLCPSGAAASSMFSPYAAASHGDSSSNSTVFQLLGSSASSQSSKHHQFWNGQESG